MVITGKMVLIAIVVGLILALIVTMAMRASLKSVHMQSSAVFYEKEEGLTLTNQRDVFSHKTLDRTPKPKEQPKQER